MRGSILAVTLLPLWATPGTVSVCTALCWDYCPCVLFWGSGEGKLCKCNETWDKTSADWETGTDPGIIWSDRYYKQLTNRLDYAGYCLHQNEVIETRWLPIYDNDAKIHT